MHKDIKSLRGKYRTKALKISDKDPATMSNTEIIKEAEKLRAIASKQVDEMIELGRGTERYTDWADKTDPLSMAKRAVSDRMRKLSIEAEFRGFSGLSRITPGGYRRMNDRARRDY